MNGKEGYWNRAILLTRRAIDTGALVPLKTELIDNNVFTKYGFETRKLLSKAPLHIRSNKPSPNPFLPWDKRLEISLIRRDHVLILNKYPVQLGHMLLISKSWSPQNGWIEMSDWEALIEVENDTLGLWFFNSSPEAGASQPHKHFQLLKRNKTQMMCPRFDWFVERIEPDNCKNNDLSRSICVLERNFTSNISPALLLNSKYQQLCKKMELGDPLVDSKPKYPYNLLITPSWIAIIRRLHDGLNGFSVNALGFAGYLLSTYESDLDWLINNGPEALLNELVHPLNK